MVARHSVMCFPFYTYWSFYVYENGLGKAKNATYISLNGREIFIDKDGNFTENIALLPGLSVITLSAEDKFGHVDEKKLEVMYQESTGVVAIGNTIINMN